MLQNCNIKFIEKNRNLKYNEENIDTKEENIYAKIKCCI